MVKGKLIIFWLVLTGLAIGFVAYKNLTSGTTNTVDRKYFHFLIVLVFVPGIVWDFSLIYIASVAATCAFLLLEVQNYILIQYPNYMIISYIP